MCDDATGGIALDWRHGGYKCCVIVRAGAEQEWAPASTWDGMEAQSAPGLFIFQSRRVGYWTIGCRDTGSKVLFFLPI